MNAISQILQHLYMSLSHLTSIFFSLLPTRMATRLRYSKDLFTSLLRIAGGRLLPTLNPVPRPLDLTGKTAIVTGSNSGIGLQIASDLARHHCTVYLACRSTTRAQTAVSTITSTHPHAQGHVFALPLDTSSLDSVRHFADDWTSSGRRVDVLVHNAGIAGPPDTQNFTGDGLEIVYATNLLGSFALTHRLERHLAPDARVVFTTSTGQYQGQFSANFALESVSGVVEAGFHCPPSKVVEVLTDGSAARYANSKAMQVALAGLLQRKWDRDGEVEGREKGGRRVVHAFTPGFTYTPIFDKIQTGSWVKDWLFVVLKATTAVAVGVDQGAATGTWLATTDDEEVVARGKGGGYWDRMARRMSAADLLSEEVLDRLWVRWERDAGVEWRS